jgi:hypothetical protein
MGQIVELRRVRPYGPEGVTNGNRNSAAYNKWSGDLKNHK